MWTSHGCCALLLPGCHHLPFSFWLLNLIEAGSCVLLFYWINLSSKTLLQLYCVLSSAETDAEQDLNHKAWTEYKDKSASFILVVCDRSGSVLGVVLRWPQVECILASGALTHCHYSLKHIKSGPSDLHTDARLRSDPRSPLSFMWGVLHSRRNVQNVKYVDDWCMLGWTCQRWLSKTDRCN